MTRLRGLGYATLLLAFAHLVFGGIVRISGSGMGCGDHWPKCYGRWFPPMDRMDLVIEVSHRYLAAFLGVMVIGLLVAAWRARREPGVGGPGGVLRVVAAALAVVIVTGGLGAVTVRNHNPAWATVPHWVLAATLFALLAVAVIRAGGFGGDTARLGGGSGKTAKGALAATVVALLAITLGGLTAKIPYAAAACPSFPLCGETPLAAPAGASHVQMTHRVLAFLLVFHLFGMVMALRKRDENAVVKRAALIAFAVTFGQILVAGAMIGMKLTPVTRVLHQAMGVLVWIATFIFWYLAHRAATPKRERKTTAERIPLHQREPQRTSA